MDGSILLATKSRHDVPLVRQMWLELQYRWLLIWFEKFPSCPVNLVRRIAFLPTADRRRKTARLVRMSSADRRELTAGHTISSSADRCMLGDDLVALPSNEASKAGI